LVAQNAAADAVTKGFSTYVANDFNATAGLIAIDYTNGQSASAANKGFLTSVDWTTFNNKQIAATGWVTPVMNANLTANRVAISDATGKAAASTVTTTELGFLTGVSSNIQTQMTGKEPTIIYAFQTLTDGATITLNGSLGINFRVTLAGNRTLAFTNITTGKTYKIEINQDATGNRHFTLPANSLVVNGYGSGTSIVLSTGSLDKDLATFVFDGTNYLWTLARDFQ